jgi:hypothetical protein
MASVSSLDRDLRSLRLSKYTPQAANEVREWIEEVLGERLSGGDLLEGLRDGIALCKYVFRKYPNPSNMCLHGSGGSTTWIPTNFDLL